MLAFLALGQLRQISGSRPAWATQKNLSINKARKSGPDLSPYPARDLGKKISVCSK